MAGGIYKKGQGYWTRMMTAMAAGLLILMGGAWLWEAFNGVVWFGTEDVYTQGTVAAVGAAFFGCLTFYLVGRKPKVVDFLIATELEMKKVNWSSRKEVVGSTWVVIGLTAFIGTLIFILDAIFFKLFGLLKVLDI